MEHSKAASFEILLGLLFQKKYEMVLFFVFCYKEFVPSEEINVR